MQVDQPVEWLHWLVSELLLTQWGLELEGDLWYRGDYAVHREVVKLPSAIDSNCQWQQYSFKRVWHQASLHTCVSSWESTAP